MKKTIVLLAFATLLTPSVLAGGKGNKKTKNKSKKFFKKIFQLFR